MSIVRSHHPGPYDNDNTCSIIRRKYSIYTWWMKVNLCWHPVLGHLGLDLFDMEASSHVRNAVHIDSDLCAKHWIRHSNRCAHWWFSLCLASWLCVSSKGMFYISSITFLCWIWLHSFNFVSILGSKIRDDEVCSQTCKRSQHEQSSYEVHGEAALQMSCLAVAFESLWCWQIELEAVVGTDRWWSLRRCWQLSQSHPKPSRELDL